MKKVKICKIFRTVTDEHVQVNVSIIDEDSNKEDVLWYRVEKEYESFLCDDCCDAIVVNLLLTAMKFGYTEIESEYPISEKLWYNLTYHVIPQYYEATKRKWPKLTITCPKVKHSFTSSGVASGLSRGVDSFATVWEYGKNFPLEDYQITHFTYFNAGAHHGMDRLTGRSKFTKRELYENQLIDTRAFCKEYGYNLIVVDSNLAVFLKDFFGGWYFDRTHTYRNLGIAMLLQRGLGKYYYSSAYNLSEWEFNPDTDSAKYEKWLIKHLSTEAIEFHNSNQEWTRMEKVQRMAELEESYNYLNVCLVDSKNCGKCLKCRRTLMELDSLGDDVLEKYHNSFDLDVYKKEDREKWFTNIWDFISQPTEEAGFIREAFVQALKTHPELIKEPTLTALPDDTKKVYVEKRNVNIRKLPSLDAERLGATSGKNEYPYLGEYKDWVKVKLDGDNIGFITKRFAVVVEK